MANLPYGLHVASKTFMVSAADYETLRASGQTAPPGTTLIDPTTNMMVGIVQGDGTVTGLTTAQTAAVQGLALGASTLTADALAWLRPRHRPILNSETYSAASVGAAAGVVASTAAAGASEFLRSDLVFTMAGATAEGNTDIPFTSDFYGAYPEVGFRFHFRVFCSDWTKVTALRVFFVANKATMTERYQFNIVDAGLSEHGMTDPAFAGAWSGQYRTVILSADRRSRNIGSGLNAWGTGGGEAEAFTAQAIRLRIATSAACVIKFNRIYSPKWPIGMVGLIGDGGYTGFRNQVVAPLAALGHRGTISLFQSGESNGEPYPYVADLRAASNAGWSVIPHLRSLTAGLAFAGTETASEIELSTRSLQRKLSDAGVAAQHSTRVGQFLQDSGRSNVGGGIYLAQEIARMGIQMTRGECVDSQWGINPFNATYTNRLSSVRPVALLVTGTNTYSVPVGYCQGWSPERGRYNLTLSSWFTADPIYSPSSITQRDTYSGSVQSSIIDKCAAYADASFSYTHNVLQNNGTEPTVFNSGLNFWNAMKNDLLTQVAAGRLLLLSMAQYAAITYWRPDDIYLRWDGEWCNKSDGAITF